jgi:radical SAM superfamily enzyme YgiQ (UPF0313 family)
MLLEHAMNVCDALTRVKHRARLQCLELNPLSFDDSLLTAMERAGFVGMGITLESASDPVLRGLKKGFTTREVHHAAEVVRRHGIPCAWIFLLGGPGETEETVKETLRFAGKQIRPGDVAFFNTGIRIYPGTELESIARRQGVLSRPPGDMLFPVFYLSPDVDASWVEQELKKSMNRHMNFLNMDSWACPSCRRFIGSAIGSVCSRRSGNIRESSDGVSGLREWMSESEGRRPPIFPVYSPASRSMIGGIRYVANFVWDPPPNTTTSFPPQTSPARSRIRSAMFQ